MIRLYSSWIGRAALTTALVTGLFAGDADEPGPLGALVLSVLGAAGVVDLGKRRTA
ncbi:hypothetical protein [Actinoplanes sp. NPDC049599]|uniref:hypothetical protein n=1 Tax=Actinoplanes sp. NPDC049599 TaxID=3363903 RepID=UPI0037A61770